jgi:putative DNA primase/helicase
MNERPPSKGGRRQAEAIEKSTSNIASPALVQALRDQGAIPSDDEPEVNSRRKGNANASNGHDHGASNDAQDHDRSSPEAAAEALRPELSEDAVALEFVERNCHLVRFDHTAGRWRVWLGNRWQNDDTGVVTEWTRAVARAMATKGERRRLGSQKFSSGVERFARTDRRVAVTSSQWDPDPDYLGTPTGVVDLVTGEPYDPDPELFITRATAVDPDFTIDQCPRFLEFCDEVTGKDPELKEFLQSFFGYCLTGDTREQKLLFIYGPGMSGKSTFVNALRQVMGDYATSASMTTFTASNFDQHPEELARLDGFRLVTANETEEGRKWRENRIKELTGGDPITARYMRQDSFTFRPKFKFAFVGNHAPGLVNVDSAIRRRILLQPFQNVPKSPDLQLEEKLAEEWPGILRWAIIGATRWYEQGRLVVPKAVTKATEQYFDNQNVFQHWIKERCREDPAVSDRSADLYADWFDYAKKAGEDPGKQKDFNDRLRLLSFVVGPNKRFNSTGVRGLQLRPNEPDPEREPDWQAPIWDEPK